MAVKRMGSVNAKRAGKQPKRPSSNLNKEIRPKGIIVAQPVRKNLPQFMTGVARQPIASLPPGYAQLLTDLKDRIRQAQVRATVAASRELVRLYWDIGREIVRRQSQEGWGKGVVDCLAADIQRAFPGVEGFSARNVWRMRAFYLAYAPETAILTRLVSEFDCTNLPQAVSEIPWGHNIVLFQKLKDRERRLWYAEKTVKHGWSRVVLVHQIELDLYGREGKAITNCAETLPAVQSDLGQQMLKDPYIFDFLTLTDNARERELHQGLLEHLRDFMLELGVGFAFVGSQYHLEVDEKDYYIDLLFYHLELRAYVAIDLKVEEFKPEFAGKMNFYLSAIDDFLRHAEDRSSIGIILCKARDRVTVEYALRDTRKPIGVSEYRLTKALPRELRSSLPTIEQLEEELKSVRIETTTDSRRIP
jgi:predicted nuclease of restriction endonuclease-like (RecB) superfamily